ncbi:MAG: hypothetical protein JSV60_00395 [Desulfobacterales bacterium]|nr:MAG: hypothetical protein JSV60_00395 [Desulfobacterales bacterium]
MSKKRKFRNRSFSMLEPDLIESEAIQGLSGKAMLVLIRFHQKAHRKKTKRQGIRWTMITNNGQIQFPYAEARELGIKSDATFYKIIRQLVEERGLVDITEPGNWYLKQPTKYAISERWKRYGTPDYKGVKIPRILPPGLGLQREHQGRPQQKSL